MSVNAKICVWAVALALLCSNRAWAQISPGPLSRPHQQWEGLTKCTACHDFGSGARGFKCVECHAEIRHELEAKTGFHGRAAKSSPGETALPDGGRNNCARCHVEHNGSVASLIQLDRSRFDHQAQTGFLLEGKHRQLACEKCHNTKKIAPAARAEIKLNDKDRSFLGLGTSCTSCHEDPHRTQLGSECSRCHNQDAWKPVPGFNHAKTNYPLTGQHQSVACQKCHSPLGAGTSPQYKGLSFSSCVGCHKDPHRGAFQEVKARGTCETCHSTGGWKLGSPSQNFNHSLTMFPLNGKHAAVECTKCHKGTDYKRPVPHESCAECHEDPHQGQFQKRAAGADCKACHNETSFKPALFTRDTHQQSAFKLEEKHASLDCVKCHQPEGKQARYMTGNLTCPACHADAHGAEFAAAPYENRCQLCHTQATFGQPTFAAAEHAKTKFPLDGAHAKVACNDCHKVMPQAAAKSAPASKGGIPVADGDYVPRQHHFASQTCESCHRDPHQTKLTCGTCHTTTQWKETRKFNHAATKFLTEGKHDAACVKCHPADPKAGPAASGPLQFPGAGVAPVFPNTPNQCFRCHADVHDGQFMESSRFEDCSACHVVARWKREDFRHETTRFPLDRLHVRVACEKCHQEQRAVNGTAVRVYRGAPMECVKCHP